MQVPENAEVTETPTSTFWFDESGILCSVSKKAPAQTLEEAKTALFNLKKMIGDRKICLLIDITNSGESNREVRDFAAVEFPKFVKAIGMVSDSELGKMIANLFFNLKHQPYPTKMFTNETEAKNWLKQYL
jgi:hypothetical protein